MKKITIFLIAIVSILGFSFAAYWGFTQRRGIPVAVEEDKKPILEVPMLDREIDLSKGIDQEFWQKQPGIEIKLLYQVMVLPWPKVVTPAVTVKAFHNHKEIYFYMTWLDQQESRALGINKFSDACAVMFPLEKNTQTSTLMMGFLGRANIWHWKAIRDKEYWGMARPQNPSYADFYYPFEDTETLAVSKETVKSAVSDLIAVRVGTVTPKEKQDISGRGIWSDAGWQVVFKRALKADDSKVDAQFLAENKLCAFAVWNGEKGDRGGRKSISDWVELVVQGDSI